MKIGQMIKKTEFSTNIHSAKYHKNRLNNQKNKIHVEKKELYKIMHYVERRYKIYFIYQTTKLEKNWRAKGTQKISILYKKMIHRTSESCTPVLEQEKDSSDNHPNWKHVQRKYYII